MVKNFKKVIENLPRGYYKKVMDEFHISKAMVYYIVHGQRTIREDILSFLIELAEKNKKTKDDLNKRIDSL